MGVNAKDIGALVLEVADANLICPKVNSAKEYFTALENTLKNTDNLQKFDEHCRELKENMKGYLGAVYGQGCPKILAGLGLVAAGAYTGLHLSTHGCALLGVPLIVLSYFALGETFRGTSERIKKLKNCVEAPEVAWKWAIHSYRKEIQERIEKFYTA